MSLRREFESREEMAAYLASEFPEAAAVDSHISELRGGRLAALAHLVAVDPERYGFSRNYLTGGATRLSAYIRHGVLSLAEVRRSALAKASHPQRVMKFLTELAWRDYWQRVYAQLGNGIWRDREEAKTGLNQAEYAAKLPEDIERAATGLACMDSFGRELHATGYLHNHARMWLASYVIHWRRVKWQAGAKWFLRHLLDGDPASNNLSWQWVASTFSHKPYIFNRENLERYSESRFCGTCAARDNCPFDASYEELDSRLFRINL